MTLAERCIGRLSPEGLAIFLFHGIVPEPPGGLRNSSGKHLDEASFRALVAGLARRGRALSMDDVVAHVQGRRPFPPRVFALTFDDGLENNASIAAPILREHGVPATFYVTTGFVEGNRMSWIDRIEHCLERAGEGALELPWFGAPRTFRDARDKTALLETIRARVKADAAVDGDALAETIFDQCGLEAVASRDDPVDRKMSWRQVRELAADELFTVGGHSHTHRILSHLDPATLQEEVAQSLTLLRVRAGVEARHYAYPEGFEWSFSPEVITVLQRQGVVCCPTALDGLNTIDDDLFGLHRINVVVD